MQKVGEDKYVAGILYSNVVNKNGRIYSPEVLENIKKQFSENKGFMFGTLGYGETVDPSVTNISHRINRIFTKRLPRKKKKKLKKSGLYNKRKSTLYCEVELFKTPKGAIAKQISEREE